MKGSSEKIKKEVHEYYKYLRLSNYQQSTVKMYCRTLEKFLLFYSDKYRGQQLCQDHAQEYLLDRVQCGKAWSTINADYSALRKYFKIVKEYEWTLRKMPRARKEKKLVPILSKEEVAKLINHAPTYKHQVFLTFLYSTGVRLSEATNVKLIDIDSKRMQIHIHRGKGAKDRKVLISDKLLVRSLIYQFFASSLSQFSGASSISSSCKSGVIDT